MAESEDKTTRAQEMVKQYALGSLGVGLVPLPFVDIALLLGIQLAMLYRLANLYGVEFTSHLGTALIASLLGSVLPVSLVPNIVRLARGLPVVGFAAGIISTSSFSGAATYAVGQVFIQHFESGNTLLTFDPQKVKAYYAEQFAAGRNEVRQNFAGIKP